MMASESVQKPLVKVMGIGLNKSGTKTLARCLHILGYRNHVSCNHALMTLYANHDIEAIFDIISLNDSFEDWPFPLIYQQVFFRFGHQVKFVLTQRKNPETWLESLKKHSLKTDPDKHYRLLAYGYNYPHGLENQHIAIYKKHISEVVAFFKYYNALDRLLLVEWESGDSWEKICGFLGHPVPDVPFPHENQSNESYKSGFEDENRRRIHQQLKLLMCDGFKNEE